MMLKEYTAAEVATDVLEHLERRRPAIVDDAAQIRAETEKALVPVKKSYQDADLPRGYLVALEEEILATIPVRWQTIARPFTEVEKRGVWRGGDLFSRLLYVFCGFVVGALPFIPFRFKWLPLLLGVAAYWLPDLQMRGRRQAYALQLGELVKQVASAQKALDRHITVQELLPPGEK
jgi:hypothetical protein